VSARAPTFEICFFEDEAVEDELPHAILKEVLKERGLPDSAINRLAVWIQSRTWCSAASLFAKRCRN
jgi:hypothetical protein